MTSKLTRERIELIANFHRAMTLPPSHAEIEELARMALAAMDSEPVQNHIGSKNSLDAIVSFIKSKSNPTVKCYEEVSEQLFKDNCHGIHSHVIEYILKLGEELEDLRAEQAEMQPAPAATTETISFDEWSRKCALQITLCYPDFREKAKYIWDSARETQQLAPAPVVSADLLHTAASAIEDLLTTKDRTGAFVWFDLPFRLRSAANAQPVTVVPDDVRQALSKMDDEIIAELDAEESACRAAMLHAGNSPAQSDCCPAQNVVSPAQSPIDHGYQPECECSGCKATARICTEMAVNSLVIPNEMTSEQAYEIGYYYGDPVDVFARGANWMRQHIIDSTLAAAPQSPGSEHATVPGKWIPVSELMPEVGDIVLTAMGGVVNVGEMECSAANCRFFTSVISGRELPATYWMPLPAAPQEVKGE